MNWLRSKKTVVVHSGNFHADDIFSVATLSLYLDEDVKIIRSRESKDISKANYVFDVGGEYDPDKNKFDHHQTGGAGKRDSGVPYAAFGLVWKQFGVKVSGSKEASDIIENKIVIPTDADDNAFEICGSFPYNVRPYTVSDYVMYVNSITEEGDRDKVFKKLVIWAKEILQMEIKIANKFLEDQMKVEMTYDFTEDKRLIVLDGDYYFDEILRKYPEPLFVIKPSPGIGAWKIYCVKVQGEKFKNRVDLPASWASKRDQELVQVTGIPDAVYCHHQRYMAIARSKEGVLRMAELALQEVEKLNNK